MCIIFTHDIICINLIIYTHIHIYVHVHTHYTYIVPLYNSGRQHGIWKSYDVSTLNVLLTTTYIHIFSCLNIPLLLTTKFTWLSSTTHTGTGACVHPRQSPQPGTVPFTRPQKNIATAWSVVARSLKAYNHVHPSSPSLE